MTIVNLIENTEGSSGCSAAHGLSFYIETKNHKILMDAGPSSETLRNAEKLGIDLKKVDIAVISHGHYDHTGGILPFAEINPDAAIYMQRAAAGEYYSDDGPEAGMRFIGVDRNALSLPQIIFAEGDMQIDEELRLMTVENRKYPVPSVNGRLREKQGENYVPDCFRHEQSLIITEGEQKTLLSGCAHNGILNILEEFRRKIGSDPDAAVSGFHLMKKTDYSDGEIEEIICTAKTLKTYRTKFYTCHCTGVPAFQMMKEIMNDQLTYVHSGDTVSPV